MPAIAVKDDEMRDYREPLHASPVTRRDFIGKGAASSGLSVLAAAGYTSQSGASSCPVKAANQCSKR